MTSVDEAQQYIDDMARKRGYVLQYHKLMAKQDFPVLQAANHLVSAAYLDQRTLPRETKELIFIVSLTVMRASKAHIQSHIRVALDLGVSPGEILEAIEISLPEAGVVASRPASRPGRRSWALTAPSPAWRPTTAARRAGLTGARSVVPSCPAL